MKFTVELDDFWMDEDGCIESELQDYIVKKVVKDITKSIEKKIDDHIKRTIDDFINKKIYSQSTKYIDDCFKSETFSIRVNENGSYVDKNVSLNEFIKDKFVKDTGWNNHLERIEKLSKKFSDDLKQKYDLYYASKVVEKLAENRMLKDDVFKMITETN